MPTDSHRRAFFSYFASLGIASTALSETLWSQAQHAPITQDSLRQAGAVAGIAFTPHELEAIVTAVNHNLEELDNLHAITLDNSVAPALYFNPILPGMKIDR